MRWLPAREFDNVVHIVFSNPLGMDDDELKNGRLMVLDSFGDILTECAALGQIAIVRCGKGEATNG